MDIANRVAQVRGALEGVDVEEIDIEEILALALAEVRFGSTLLVEEHVTRRLGNLEARVKIEDLRTELS